MSKLNEADDQTGPEVDVITGPAHWAGYFINGDASDLAPDDKKAADRWLKKIEPWYVVGTTDDEERISNHYDIHSGTDFRSGSVIDYIVHKDRNRPEQVPAGSMSQDTPDSMSGPQTPPAGSF
jgi:hypothetical protein